MYISRDAVHNAHHFMDLRTISRKISFLSKSIKSAIEKFNRVKHIVSNEILVFIVQSESHV